MIHKNKQTHTHKTFFITTQYLEKYRSTVQQLAHKG